MILERTILQLDIGDIPADEARQMGQLGYMQWIAGLPGNTSYFQAARDAHDKAAPSSIHSPAVAEFCELLLSLLEAPLTPLQLALPKRRRRGGAQARRSHRLPL